MAKQLFRATETFFHDSSPVAIRVDQILPEDNPAVLACPQYFEAVEKGAARDEARWEAAVGGPGEARDVSVPKKVGRPRKTPEASEES